LWALVIEPFRRSSLNLGTVERLDSVMKQLTLALPNARRYSRLVSIPGLYQLV